MRNINKNKEYLIRTSGFENTINCNFFEHDDLKHENFNNLQINDVIYIGNIFYNVSFIIKSKNNIRIILTYNKINFRINY